MGQSGGFLLVTFGCLVFLFLMCTSLNILFFLVIASAEEGFAEVIISPASLATMTRKSRMANSSGTWKDISECQQSGLWSSVLSQPP